MEAADLYLSLFNYYLYPHVKGKENSAGRNW